MYIYVYTCIYMCVCIDLRASPPPLSPTSTYPSPPQTPTTPPPNTTQINTEPRPPRAQLQPRAEDPATPPPARHPGQLFGHGVDPGVGGCVKGLGCCVVCICIVPCCRTGAITDNSLVYIHTRKRKHTYITPMFGTCFNLGRCSTSWCTWRSGSTATSSTRAWRK